MKVWYFSLKTSAGLRYWLHWFGLGVGMTVVVVYLSLANTHIPQVPSTVGDKVNHLIAYGVLCTWFGQLFKNQLHRNVIAIGLILLGVLMEVLQGLTAYRYFDLLDAVANSLGVSVGLLALYFGADRMLLRFENDFLKAS